MLHYPIFLSATWPRQVLPLLVTLAVMDFFPFNCKCRPSHGFIDGDLVELFLDLDHPSMKAVVKELNQDGGWDIDNFAM
jgi:hypothetical protein